jgi:hypothetical protein
MEYRDHDNPCDEDEECLSDMDSPLDLLQVVQWKPHLDCFSFSPRLLNGSDIIREQR